MRVINSKGAIMISGGLLLLLMTEVLRLFSFDSVVEFRRLYNSTLIEPLEILSVFLIGIGVYLLFFNQAIQQKWWRWSRWYLVLIILPILVFVESRATGFISLVSSTDIVVWLGMVWSVITIVQTAVLRFYYKDGIA